MVVCGGCREDEGWAGGEKHPGTQFDNAFMWGIGRVDMQRSGMMA